MLVLFQNKSDIPTKPKCKISEIPPIQAGRKAWIGGSLNWMIFLVNRFCLTFQTIPSQNHFHRVFKLVPVSHMSATKLMKFLSASRNMALPQMSHCNPGFVDEMSTWHGVHALVSNKILTCKTPAFLPVLPYPVMQHDTVYTCLNNFSKICDLLPQKLLRIFCDEGVFQYVVDIYLCNPEVFFNIMPMMGIFHLTKAAFHCIG